MDLDGKDIKILDIYRNRGYDQMLKDNKPNPQTKKTRTDGSRVMVYKYVPKFYPYIKLTPQEYRLIDEIISSETKDRMIHEINELL